MSDKTPPQRIWLLDYGSDECTWCDDPSPSGEDHQPVEYVRADVAQSKLDRAVEALEPFTRGPDGTSLAKLYAHLTRDHYRNARATLSFIKDGQ